MKSDPQTAHKQRRYRQRRFINADSTALTEDRKKITKIRKASKELALQRLTQKAEYKWSYQTWLDEYE
jgi:hypothetical protein